MMLKRVTSESVRIFVMPDGRIVGLYSDDIDYAALGKSSITRGAHVEPDTEGDGWQVEFEDKTRTVVRGFSSRNEALDFEVAVLTRKLRRNKL